MHADLTVTYVTQSSVIRAGLNAVFPQQLATLEERCRSVGGATQLWRAFRFRRLRSHLGFDRLDPGSLDLQRFDARGYFHRAGPHPRTQRTRPRGPSRPGAAIRPAATHRRASSPRITWRGSARAITAAALTAPNTKRASML